MTPKAELGSDPPWGMWVPDETEPGRWQPYVTAMGSYAVFGLVYPDRESCQAFIDEHLSDAWQVVGDLAAVRRRETYGGGVYYCPLCDAREGTDHEADCLILRAQAVGGGEATG